MTNNKYFNHDEIKSWAQFLIQNVDQLEGYDLSELIYDSYAVYCADKDQVVMMFDVNNKYLSGDLYLTFPRAILGEIKRMHNDVAFFEKNLVGFGFIPNPITK